MKEQVDRFDNNQRVVQEVDDRAPVLATGLNYGQDAVDKAAASIRLGTMGVTPPDNGAGLPHEIE